MWLYAQQKLKILLRKKRKIILTEKSLCHTTFFFYIMFYSVTSEWNILFVFAISFKTLYLKGQEILSINVP